MIQFERIDISEGIDINKSNKSQECMLCHYWYFKDTGDEYEQYVCNGCHELSIVVYGLNDFMILTTKGADYRCFVFD